MRIEITWAKNNMNVLLLLFGSSSLEEEYIVNSYMFMFSMITGLTFNK